MEALRQAQQAVRQLVLDENDEASWARRREEIAEQVQLAGEYSAATNRAHVRALTEDVVTRVNAAVLAAEGEIVRAAEPATRTQPPPPPAEDDAGGHDKTRTRRRRFRRAAAAPDPAEQTDREYQKAQENLAKLRRGAQGFAAAEEQRGVALEPEMNVRLRQDHDCLAASANALEARDSLAAALLAQGTLPAARAFVNARLANLTSSTMTIPQESGLYDTLPRSNPVITDAILRVFEWLRRMKGASLGIAGPRGAGKTTLMEYFCDSRAWVRLRVSAPVEYVPLDFIRYLLAEFCEAVLLLHPDEVTQDAGRVPPTETWTARAVRRLRLIDTGTDRLSIFALRLLSLLAVPPVAVSALAGDSHLARTAASVTALSMLLTVFLWVRRRPGFSGHCS